MKFNLLLANPLSTSVLVLLLAGCATPNYTKRDGPTSQLEDNSVRYGSIAGLGAAGFFAGRHIGGNNTAGAVGAVTGVAAGYGLNKFMDNKRKDAYRTGLEDGADAARAEIVNEKWKREAIYGVKDEETRTPRPIYRQVYVPAREFNGVKMEAEYQTVQIVK